METAQPNILAQIAKAKIPPQAEVRAPQKLEALPIKDTVITGMMRSIHDKLFPSERADSKMVAEYAKQMFLDIEGIERWIHHIPSIETLDRLLPMLSNQLFNAAGSFAESSQVTLRDPSLAWKARRVLAHMMSSLETDEDNKLVQLRESMGGLPRVKLAGHIHAEVARFAGILTALPEIKGIQIVRFGDLAQGYKLQIPLNGTDTTKPSIYIVVGKESSNIMPLDPLSLDKSNMRDASMAHAFVSRVHKDAIQPIATKLASQSEDNVVVVLDPKQFDQFTLQEGAAFVRTALRNRGGALAQRLDHAQESMRSIRRGLFVYDVRQVSLDSTELSKNMVGMVLQAEALLFDRLDKKSKDYLKDHVDRSKAKQHAQTILTALSALAVDRMKLEEARMADPTAKETPEYSIRGKDIMSLIVAVGDVSEKLVGTASGDSREKGTYRAWARAVVADVIDRCTSSTPQAQSTNIKVAVHMENIYYEVIMQAGVRRNLPILEAPAPEEDMKQQVDYWLQDSDTGSRIPVQVKRTHEYPEGPVRIFRASTPIVMDRSSKVVRSITQKANRFFVLHPNGVFMVFPFHMFDPVSLRIHPQHCSQSADDILTQLKKGTI